MPLPLLAPTSQPFDAVVIGGGMFGAYCAERLYRFGAPAAFRVLVIEAGAFVLPTHIQNLPQRLGGSLGGAAKPSKADEGFNNVIWRVPWLSNESFPGLAYCVGGRSLFWGGWSPRMVPNDLAPWPASVRTFLNSANGYALTEQEIGVTPSTDYIVKATLFTTRRDTRSRSTSGDSIRRATPRGMQPNGPGPSTTCRRPRASPRGQSGCGTDMRLRRRTTPSG